MDRGRAPNGIGHLMILLSQDITEDLPQIYQRWQRYSVWRVPRRPEERGSRTLFYQIVKGEIAVSSEDIRALPVPEIEALSLTKLHTSGGRRNM